MKAPPALALLVRSLQEGARAGSTYLWRFALIVSLLWTFFLALLVSSLLGDPGLQMFRNIFGVNIFIISLAACSIYATPITEEKRDGTLGLLRMTRLGPLAILLGKSASRLLSGTLLVAVQFPFTLLAITLGGVSIYQVVAAYLCLASHLILVAGLGLFWSVISPTSRRAGAEVFFSLLAFYVLPGLTGATLGLLENQGILSTSSAPASWILDLASQVSRAAPSASMNLILTTGFEGTPFTFQFGSNLIAGVIFFLLAWFSFNFFNLDDLPPESGGFVSRLLSRHRRSRTSWRFSLAWKDYHFIGGGHWMVALKVFLYGLTAVVMALWLKGWDAFDRDTLMQILMTIYFVAFLVELAILASLIFAREIRDGTLSSLLTLPRSTMGIAYEKIAGCALALIPVSCFFGLSALLAPELFFDALEEMFREPVSIWYSGCGLLFFYHLVAFLSLYLRWGALIAALGISAVLLVGSMVTIGLLSFVTGDPEPRFIFFMTGLGGLAAAIFMHVNCGHRLRKLAER